MGRMGRIQDLYINSNIGILMSNFKQQQRALRWRRCKDLLGYLIMFIIVSSIIVTALMLKRS